MGGGWTTPVPKPTVVRDAETAAESEQREKERGSHGARVESVAKRRRRTFSAAEKLRILKRADACLASGTRGALEAMLREEGIYSSHLSTWRSHVAAKGAAGLAPRPTGRPPKMDAKDRAYAALEKRNAELEHKLHVATALLSLQKKAQELLAMAFPASDDES